MNKYKEKAARHREIVKAREESLEGKAVWKRFDNSVAECRRLENKWDLPVWRTYWSLTLHKIVEMPDEDLPQEYLEALAEWNAARLERDKLYVT